MSLVHIDNAIVGYLDILGFKALVRADGNRHEIAKKLESAMRRALEWFGGLVTLRGTPEAQWKIRIFSDCLCVSKPTTDLGIFLTLNAVAAFTREMVAAGFPIRGGLTIGPHSESELMLFSQAQIEAYELESSEARNPRIVLSPGFLERVEAIEDDEIRKDTKEYIVVDEDYVSFINYLIFEEEDEWLSGHEFYYRQKLALDEALSNKKIDSTVRSKYLWIARFHNWSLRHAARILKQGGIMSEDDVWNFSSLVVNEAPTDSSFQSLLWIDRSFERAVKIINEKNIDWIKQWPGVTTEDDEEEMVE
jgi:hypothetical protein